MPPRRSKPARRPLPEHALPAIALPSITGQKAAVGEDSKTEGTKPVRPAGHVALTGGPPRAARQPNAICWNDCLGMSLDWTAVMSSFQDQLVEHRVYLIRFAQLQLRNDAWAKDAVSETLLTALSKPQAFGNRSQLKTWLVGILKNKVIDLIRSNARTVALPDSGGDDRADELDRLRFKADGHFEHSPNDWGDPHQTLQQAQFFEVLDICMERLPPAMGRLFLMRE
jgi:RNA polymerase sigma-70 factor (TIGR02943 family)